jgi:hypothetical protein
MSKNFYEKIFALSIIKKFENLPNDKNLNFNEEIFNIRILNNEKNYLCNFK